MVHLREAGVTLVSVHRYFLSSISFFVTALQTGMLEGHSVFPLKGVCALKPALHLWLSIGFRIKGLYSSRVEKT